MATALFANIPMAEAWNITQITTITNATTMEQTGATIDSLQSINAIHNNAIELEDSQKITQNTGAMT